ncbi:unnamed protein product [Symbiodinium natans]|uniref:Uncharacterized protein n=1 Tax=Symbiodinium natans TaxID=878477 RepID=A0A812LBD6_9DINO|nr:unnamed protein product [Symbiodinium natans]
MVQAGLECLLADEVLNLLFLALDGSAFPLETRERACLLLCYLANSSEKVKSAISRGGSALWQSILTTLKD